jgi:hypothetical protein
MLMAVTKVRVFLQYTIYSITRIYFTKFVFTLYAVMQNSNISHPQYHGSTTLRLLNFSTISQQISQQISHLLLTLALLQLRTTPRLFTYSYPTLSFHISTAQNPPHILIHTPSNFTMPMPPQQPFQRPLMLSDLLQNLHRLAASLSIDLDLDLELDPSSDVDIEIRTGIEIGERNARPLRPLGYDLQRERSRSGRAVIVLVSMDGDEDLDFDQDSNLGLERDSRCTHTQPIKATRRLGPIETEGKQRLSTPPESEKKEMETGIKRDEQETKQEQEQTAKQRRSWKRVRLLTRLPRLLRRQRDVSHQEL